MPQQDQKSSTSRDALIQGLNEDLAREYQAIIAYVTYSKVLKGAQYMNIAGELEKHAGEELQHALTVAEQIDYLGGTPGVQPKPVKVTDDNEEMLRADLANEVATIQNYRVRIHQCEDLQEYAMAELLREILTQEQDHLIALATALGIDAPRVDTAQPSSESTGASQHPPKQTSAGR
jgi:bacterioferritin